MMTQRELEQFAREIAVQITDAQHGYTMEFSSNPAAHSEEYDRAETVLARVLAERFKVTNGIVERFVPETSRPEPDPTIMEAVQAATLNPEPDKPCQAYTVANNKELATRLVNVIAPHWDKHIKNVAIEDVTTFLWQHLTRMWDDIVVFHHKFGITYNGPPRRLPWDLAQFRIKFMQEELDEYAENYGRLEEVNPGNTVIIDEEDTLERREKMLDALVDLVYVALGTAYLHGFNFAEAWRRVQGANMGKVRALKESDSKRGSTYDVVKPEGWKAPSHIDLVGTLQCFEPEADHELF